MKVFFKGLNTDQENALKGKIVRYLFCLFQEKILARSQITFFPSKSQLSVSKKINHALQNKCRNFDLKQKRKIFGPIYFKI